jgi:hypothetical protein
MLRQDIANNSLGLGYLVNLVKKTDTSVASEHAAKVVLWLYDIVKKCGWLMRLLARLGLVKGAITPR